MPTSSYDTKPWDIDPRRWARCMREAAASMVAQGRHPRALCPMVQAKRARRLFYAH
jgi:hypothetical protein